MTSKFNDQPDDVTNIDASLVTTLIASQFPRWSDLPIAAVRFDGWDNRTFRYGEVLPMRHPSAAGYSGQVDKEHRWLPVLAPLLPLPIPAPLALGAPGAGYPWKWSVYRWIDGTIASHARIDDLHDFAKSLGDFLAALQQIDSSDGPPPGPQNCFRGGPLKTYDAETRRSIVALAGRIGTEAATDVWDAAMASTWEGSPVWFHGDMASGNLIVDDGRLSAVIDFGCSGVGDPACDLTIAWTFLAGGSREAFRAVVPADEGSWTRGRGWALWKALIQLVEHIDSNPAEAARARQVIDEVLADHDRST